MVFVYECFEVYEKYDDKDDGPSEMRRDVKTEGLGNFKSEEFLSGKNKMV